MKDQIERHLSAKEVLSLEELMNYIRIYNNQRPDEEMSRRADIVKYILDVGIKKRTLRSYQDINVSNGENGHTLRFKIKATGSPFIWPVVIDLERNSNDFLFRRQIQ